MIGEIENNRDHDGGHDHDDESSIPEMFRSTSGLLDSLDKLTNEIKANLMSDEEQGSVTGSNESSFNEDEDFYWDDEDNYYSDDDDPDSGENMLFSMMDELVMELMMEIEDDRTEGDKGDQLVTDEENDDSIMNKGERFCASEIAGADLISKGNKQQTIEPDDSVQPLLSNTSPKDCASLTLDSNSNQPIDERAQKHITLHQHVKTLLLQVTELTSSMSVKKRKAMKSEYNDKISANIQRKIEQGDYDADRLEHLMGAIATYGKYREANTSAIESLSSQSKQTSKVKIKKKTRKKRTNKHKRRKSKSFVQTQQSLQILFDSLKALDEKLSQEKLPINHTNS